MMTAKQSATMPTTKAAKRPTTFLDLPAELRNYIYDLSGCLQIWRCTRPGCKRAATRDIAQRYFIVCRKNKNGTQRCFTERADLTLIPSHIRGESRAVLCADTDQPRSRMFVRDLPTAAQQPALTKVCRAIRKETLPMFYGSNRFIASAMYCDNAKVVSQKFFRTIGPSNTALLRCFVNNVRRIDQMKSLRLLCQRKYIADVDKAFPALGLRASAFSYMDEKQLEEATSYNAG